jgi:hypothetical protein
VGADGRGTDLHWVALFCLVMAHHVVVDKVTDWYGDKEVTIGLGRIVASL